MAIRSNKAIPETELQHLPKLENTQPSGSFKSRGIGNMMLTALTTPTPSSPNLPVHFYCSSGGNAGLACATTAATLHRPATIVVPTSTSAFMVAKLRELGRRSTKVLAMETQGAESLFESVRAGELVTLPGITSIATSLGARRVSEKTWEWVEKAGDGLVSATVSDAEAAMACVRFLDDARILIEVACGATIATAYNGDLRRYLGEGLTDDEWARRNVVLVVCGGSNTSLEILDKYKAMYGIE
ncbi:catabolic L-serine/threonine dehydratase [Collariella sp. IMI 366227]|nr:catabolic L-serine/threonine dehydratase [Collariella sp. IMI 366227]